MHTSDESARGESPERSSSLETPDEDVRCGAIVKKTGAPCKNYPVRGGRCRWHVIDEVVPESELEALRQLQEAAAQHALDAFHAIEGGENGEHGEQDQAFNRNARTAAQLARIRQGLVHPKADKIEGEGEEPATIDIADDPRKTASPEPDKKD
jgi:hypothetical protein